MASRQPLRAGMTLIEVLLALAILAIIAAVVYPTAASQLRQGHSSALANQFANLREAIANYRENVGAFPISLTQLTNQPVNGDDDSCGANLSAAERNAWRGPYINQNVVGGLPVGNAVVVPALQRVGGTPLGTLQIQATSVDSDIADDLEAQFDGNANFATGTILWSAGTLTFQIPIRGC